MWADGHRYRLLSLLGEGGSARVYRALQIRKDGVSREIAVKMLSAAAGPEAAERLRAEALLLGLVCDRAIVSVEPPIWIGDQIAVVMEHASGVTLRALLLRGPLPCAVALEITAEIARALRALFDAEGPEGKPLRVVHRDIKPGNILISPLGEVKLLDFGLSRADLPGMSLPAGEISGTPGYIPPERAFGADGPEGDIFALGVVLHEALSGTRPQSPPCGDLPDPRDLPEGVQQEPLALAARMRATDPALRPTAREVERQARRLLRDLRGEDLQEWAAREVPDSPDLPPDEHVGSTYPKPARRALPLALSLSALLLLALPLFARLSGLSEAADPEVLEQEVLEAEVEVSAGLPSSVIPAPKPPSLGSAQILPPTKPKPAPQPRPMPLAATPERIAPAPAPSEVAPSPKPESSPPDAGAAYEVLIVSIPFGATVERLDTGEILGKTPLRRSLPSGSHLVRLTAPDGRTSETRLAVGRSMPVRYVWRSAEDRWESGY